MASTRRIQTALLPDFYKKISGHDAEETQSHLKLPQKPKQTEFEIKWEPPQIFENYIPQPSIRVSA